MSPRIAVTKKYPSKIASPSGIVTANRMLSRPRGPAPLMGWVEGYGSMSTFPTIPAPYEMMNHGSVCANVDTSNWMMLNANKKSIAVTSMDIELDLNNELKKNVNPSTATRKINEKINDSPNWK